MPSVSSPARPRGAQDKDGKIAYLEKIIALVGIALQAPCPAKPAKASPTLSVLYAYSYGNGIALEAPKPREAAKVQ